MPRLYLRLVVLLVLITGSCALALSTQAATLPRVLGVEIDFPDEFSQPENQDIAPEENIFELKNHAYRITKLDGWQFDNYKNSLTISKEGSASVGGILLTMAPAIGQAAADESAYYVLLDSFVRTGLFSDQINFIDVGTVQINGHSARKMTISYEGMTIEYYLFPYGSNYIVLATIPSISGTDKPSIDTMVQSLVIGPTPALEPRIPNYSDTASNVTLTPSDTWIIATSTDNYDQSTQIGHQTYKNVFATINVQKLYGYEKSIEEILKSLSYYSPVSLYKNNPSYEATLENQNTTYKISETIQPVVQTRFNIHKKSSNQIITQVETYDIITTKYVIQLGLYIYNPTDQTVAQVTADFHNGILNKLQVGDPMWQPTVPKPPVVIEPKPVPEPTPIPDPVPPQPTIDPKTIQLKSDDHVRGSLKAPVVLVEYTDLECPFCKSFHPTLKAIQEAYGDKVAWVYRPFPLSFHVNADKEAQAAECVASIGGNDKFWSYIDAIFDRTTSNGTGFPLENLAPLAQEIGIDQTTFTECLDSEQFANTIADSLAEGQTAGVMGTPNTFVMIEGKTFSILPGALPRTSVEEAIKNALASIGITSNYDSTATKKITVNNKKLRANVSGRIVLKVEDRGRAYYVNPKTNVGHFLGKAEDAYQVMRREGVGITTADLNKIPLGSNSTSGQDTDRDGLPDAFEDAIGTFKDSNDSDNDGYMDGEEVSNGYNPAGPGRQKFDPSFSNKNKGVIFLQVEHKGEAWYINPADGKRYFLGRAEDAYQAMRNLGLGITNADFNQLGSTK